MEITIVLSKQTLRLCGVLLGTRNTEGAQTLGPKGQTIFLKRDNYFNFDM